MKGQVQPLIGIMIVLLIGVSVVVPVVMETTNSATLSYTIVNEEITGTNATSDTLDYPKLVSSVTVYNATGGSVEITSGNYTLDATNGVISWEHLDNAVYPTPQFVNYTGHHTSYQTSGSSRTMLGVLPLLIVVALVLIVVAWMKFN